MRLIPPKTTKYSEIEYYRSIMPIVRYINTQFKELVMPKAKEVLDGDLSVINASIYLLTKKINSKIDNKLISRLANQVTNLIHKRNRSLWKKKLDKVGFGISIKGKESFKGEQDYIKSRVQTNIKLITKLKNEYLTDLAVDIEMAYQKGLTSSDLADMISKKYEVSKKKAKLIARNEVKNTNSQLNNKQVKELGFDKAVWITSGDERVRSQHRKHNRKTYTIGEGLPDGEGGMEEPADKINCRCTFYIDI